MNQRKSAVPIGTTIEHPPWTTLLHQQEVHSDHYPFTELRYDLNGQDYLVIPLPSDDPHETVIHIPVSRERLERLWRGQTPLSTIIGNADHIFTQPADWLLQNQQTTIYTAGDIYRLPQDHPVMQALAQATTPEMETPTPLSADQLTQWTEDTRRAMTMW